MRNSHQGFTLIEIVTVIIILAILSTVIIPQFINLKSDAESASVNRLKGALIEGANLVHAKASIDKLNHGTQVITINSGNVNIRGGYPQVATNCSRFTAQLDYWLSINLDDDICSGTASDDWFGVVDRNSFHFMPAGYQSITENCYVTYITASEHDGTSWVDADSATILSDDSGCGE